MKIRLRVDDLGSRIRLKVPRDASIAVSSSYVSGGGSVYPVYEGDYVVRPQPYDDVILPTAYRTMEDDVTVEKIPYYLTTNQANGYTAKIGD